MKYIVLYNPKSGNGAGAAESNTLGNIISDGELVFKDLTAIDNYKDFFENLAADDIIIICGGDGTLNHFANDTRNITIKNRIDYYATGSGNDFLRDINVNKGEIAENINKYFENLPEVTVKGKNYLVLNGVGYGIDGYCCEVGDKLRATSDKPINYAGIAIKGLLFYFKPRSAEITIDGVKHSYKKVWLAPTMNGRFYGGGMMPTPNQNRLDPSHLLSIFVWHDSGKLSTLSAFPGIFKGTHLSHQKMCEVLTGHEISVRFDKPCALQVDGETILDVIEYKIVSK